MKTIVQISPERKSFNMNDVAPLVKPAVTLKPFDDRTVQFFDDLSKAIMNSGELNRVAEIVSLAFWLRKANINQYIKENNHLVDQHNYKISPVGIVFHVCPSNVDTMFMYSLAVSLLMGNRNILRVSQREGSSHLNTLFNVVNDHVAKRENNYFRNYFSIVTYGHDKVINEYFSLHANARMIWGGDATIETFQSFPVMPRTKDIVFADRVSYSLFKSSEFLSCSEKEKSEVAEKFYNDSYSFNQKGCSCPQTIFILGKESDNKLFRNEFYEALRIVVLKKYDADIYSLSSLKLNRLAENAMDEKISDVIEKNNHVVFAELNNSSDASGTCGGGLFYTKSINELKDIFPFINSKVQTVGYFGLDEKELKTLAELSSGKGIDRLVPVGKALDFHYIWDGYNLFNELCVNRFVL